MNGTEFRVKGRVFARRVRKSFLLAWRIISSVFEVPGFV